ncbi:MAG TPA: EI24 domain-containing protein [Caulobacterales bacterium]|nr:EI24 domain-containing protein [Caulobacterales bacterium]
MTKAIAAIFGALGDILGGRLTLLALINLVLAGAISGAGALAAIHYIQPLIPHAQGWLGFLFDLARFVFGAGAIVLAAALSPAASMFVGGLLFDTAARTVEKAIGAPTPGKMSLLESVWSGVRIAIPSLLLNLIVLPLYLIPGINALVFYALNGYLMGRDYAMTAAMRRLPFRDALRLRRRNRFAVFLVGVVCALVPFIGPLIGASGMTRLVHALSASSGTGKPA